MSPVLQLLQQKEFVRAMMCLVCFSIVGGALFLISFDSVIAQSRLDPAQAENEAQGRLDPSQAENEPQQTQAEFEAERFAPQFRESGPEFAEEEAQRPEFAEEQPQETESGLIIPIGDPNAPPRPTAPAPSETTPSPVSSTNPPATDVPAGGLVAACEGTSCSACDLVDLANNVIKWLIGIMFLLFAVLTVIAGFGLVTSGGNTGALQDAKKKLTNGIIGIVIVMAAWLLVDTMMRGLIGDNGEIRGYGPWSEIECGRQVETGIVAGFYESIEYPVQSAAQLADVYGPIDTSGATVAAGNCSPATLQSMGMNAVQANTFSCIAQAESGCDNNAANKVSSARGIFQITRGWNDTCHNLNLPACSAAVGVSGNLNCSRAFGAGGRVKAGMEALAAQCNRAASNQQCNVAAALCLYNDRNSGYGPWLGTKASPHRKQLACVAKFAK